MKKASNKTKKKRSLSVEIAQIIDKTFEPPFISFGESLFRYFLTIPLRSRGGNGFLNDWRAKKILNVLAQSINVSYIDFSLRENISLSETSPQTQTCIKIQINNQCKN